MMLLHPAVIPARPPEYDRLSMTGGIMQRNYATNEIAIMGHKENVSIILIKLIPTFFI
jgi:hypothetical protein